MTHPLSVWHHSKSDEPGEPSSTRAAVQRMADLAFLPVKDQLKPGTCPLCDNTCKIGHEISFMLHFYKPLALRTRAQVRGYVIDVEREGSHGRVGSLVGAPT